MASIYETVKDNPEARLPDQGDIILQPGEIWVPGAYEGTVLRSNYSIKQHIWVDWLASRKVRNFINNPTPDSMSAVEACLSKYSAISLVDPVISFLSRGKPEEEKYFTAGKMLATLSEKREAVKLGIALMGQTGLSEGAEIAETLSGCEEFTLYGVVAIKNILPPEKSKEVLFRLGEKLKGWGKIALIYELDFEKEDVRHWALCHGCENSIGLSYLANACAIKGKMSAFLNGVKASGEVLSDDEFKGISNIFKGLLENDEVNDGIYDYPDAKDASSAFSEIIKRSPGQMAEAASIIESLPFKN